MPAVSPVKSITAHHRAAPHLQSAIQSEFIGTKWPFRFIDKVYETLDTALRSISNPPPVPARKTQCSGATFRRAVFSAKEVPGAQFLSPRAQTHLPFGCSVVGVMWKPKASLNLQKKISSLGLYMVPGQQYVRTCRWSNALV
jgi:hypothetical protein